MFPCPTRASWIWQVDIGTAWAFIATRSQWVTLTTLFMRSFPSAAFIPISLQFYCQYALQSPGLDNVTLEVFNTAGRLVSSLEMGAMVEGQHIVSWNICGTSGQPLSNGVHIIRIVSESGNFATAQVILLR